MNVRGHSRGHPRGRSRGGFRGPTRGPTRGVKFRGSRALCLSEVGWTGKKETRMCEKKDGEERERATSVLGLLATSPTDSF